MFFLRVKLIEKKYISMFLWVNDINDNFKKN